MRASTKWNAEILQRFAVVTNKSTTLVTEGCRRLRGVAVTSPSLLQNGCERKAVQDPAFPYKDHDRMVSALAASRSFNHTTRS